MSQTPRPYNRKPKITIKTLNKPKNTQNQTKTRLKNLEPINRVDRVRLQSARTPASPRGPRDSPADLRGCEMLVLRAGGVLRFSVVPEL